jgi:uncharacterized integral membrane protein
MASYLKGVVLIIVLLFLVTFGVENSQATRLTYYLERLDFQIPLYGIIYISILVGILIGMAMGLWRRFELKRQIRRLQEENNELKGSGGKLEEEMEKGPSAP